MVGSGVGRGVDTIGMKRRSTKLRRRKDGREGEMKAKYEGVCLNCGMWFPPGTTIERHSQFGWKHKDCPPFPESAQLLVKSLTELLAVYIAAHPEQCEHHQLPEWVKLAVSKWFENSRLDMHESEEVRNLPVSERIRYKREARAERDRARKEVLQSLTQALRVICDGDYQREDGD